MKESRHGFPGSIEKTRDGNMCSHAMDFSQQKNWSKDHRYTHQGKSALIVATIKLSSCNLQSISQPCTNDSAIKGFCGKQCVAIFLQYLERISQVTDGKHPNTCYGSYPQVVPKTKIIGNWKPEYQFLRKMAVVNSISWQHGTMQWSPGTHSRADAGMNQVPRIPFAA